MRDTIMTEPWLELVKLFPCSTEQETYPAIKYQNTNKAKNSNIHWQDKYHAQLCWARKKSIAGI